MNTRLKSNSISFDSIIGKDPVFSKAIETAKKAARADVHILLVGETGVGKEMFARAIHEASQRNTKVFYAENCGAIPAGLAESLFFGTEKGAFTDAICQAGIFERASGGTLFLDELNSMPPYIQAKFLRVISEGCVCRVGGYNPIPIDTRIIAALNEEPELLIQEGRLRTDFYYRLNSVKIIIPPLREHKSDIPLLVEQFIMNCNDKYNVNVGGIEERAITALMEYSFPGNTRELKNIVERIILLENDIQKITLNQINTYLIG